MQSMQTLYLNSSKSWLDKHSSPTHSCNPSKARQVTEYRTLTVDVPWLPGFCGWGLKLLESYWKATTTRALHRQQTEPNLQPPYGKGLELVPGLQQEAQASGLPHI